MTLTGPAEVGTPAIPRTGVIAQLLPTPRVFGFLALLLVGGIGLGAKEVARWQYLRESFTTTWGLGMAAAAAALAIAATSLMLGRVVDRRDPRPFVLLAMLVSGVGNLVVGTMLLAGPLPTAAVLASALLDGATLGIAAVSVLKVQAAFVRPGAEGAVEILNILRLGIGGVVGALLAGLSPSPGVTLLAIGSCLLVASAGLWAVMRPVVPRRVPVAAGTDGSVLDYLRRAPAVLGLVRIDLILSLVIPTQLVSLALFDLDAPDLAARAIAAGMLGVLLGRLALTLLGFRGNLRVIVVTGIALLALVQALCAAALTDDWLLGQPLALPAAITAGSICSTYVQGLTAALLQQEVAEQMRGRLGAVLVAGRNVLISLAALAGAVLAEQLGSQVLLLVLASGLVIVTAATRGFAALPGP